jgi:hypothetical protein
MEFSICYRWNRRKGMAVGPEEDHKHFNDFGKGHLYSLRE